MFKWFQNLKMEYRVLVVVLAILILFAILFPRSTVYSYTYNYPTKQESFENEGFENTNEPTLVLFKVEWCGFCKRFLPQWMEFQKTSPIRTLTVDCDEFPDIAKRYNVNGFPQVKFYPNGTSKDDIMDYDGERTKDALMAFVQKMSSVDHFSNFEQFESQGGILPTIKMPHMAKKFQDLLPSKSVKDDHLLEKFENQQRKELATRVIGYPSEMPDDASKYPFS